MSHSGPRSRLPFALARVGHGPAIEGPAQSGAVCGLDGNPNGIGIGVGVGLGVGLGLGLGLGLGMGLGVGVGTVTVCAVANSAYT